MVCNMLRINTDGYCQHTAVASIKPAGFTKWPSLNDTVSHVLWVGTMLGLYNHWWRASFDFINTLHLTIASLCKGCFVNFAVTSSITCSKQPNLVNDDASKLEMGLYDGVLYPEYNAIKYVAIRQISTESHDFVVVHHDSIWFNLQPLLAHTESCVISCQKDIFHENKAPASKIF